LANVQRGRIVTIGLIVTTLAMSALTIYFYVSVKGTDKLSSQIIRFALTSWLMWGLYRGSSAARWITIVLFCLGGFLGLSTILLQNRAASFVGVKMGMTYLTLAGILLTSSDVEAFRLSQQERQRHP
jgi:hypothetical protein